MPTAPRAVTHPRLASLRHAAEYADVHPRTIRRWIDNGLLPGYKVGPKLLKVDLDELDQLVRPYASRRSAR